MFLNVGGIKCTFDFEVICAFNVRLCVGPILSGVPTVNVVNKLVSVELLWPYTPTFNGVLFTLSPYVAL